MRGQIQCLFDENLRFDDMLIDLGTAEGRAEVCGLASSGGIQVLFLDPFNGFIGSIDPRDTPVLLQHAAGIDPEASRHGLYADPRAPHGRGPRVRRAKPPP